MAKNWMAWEAAEALYSDNKEEIAEVASRYPLFARTVCMENSEYLLDILKALPKVTARVVETGLKELEGEPEVEETEEASDKNEEKEIKKEKAPKGKAKAKQEEELDEDEAEDEDEKDYSSMTSKELYALCCKRGLSSKCKKRDKASLIAVLKAADGAGEDEGSDDDWEDEEEEETKDPYAGKTAKELYMMCKQRGIKAAPKKDAAEYAKLLKKADEAEQEEDSDDDDDWEI